MPPTGAHRGVLAAAAVVVVAGLIGAAVLPCTPGSRADPLDPHDAPVAENGSPALAVCPPAAHLGAP